jgi:hypothetical protein
MNILEKMNNLSGLIEYKALFVLYLIIAANFLAQTFGCKTQYLLNNNMYVKHLIGLFTLFFFVTLLSPVNQNIDSDENLYFKKIGITVLLYVLFLLSTRTKGLFFNIFLSLIGFNYILNTYADSLNKDIHKEKIEKIRKVAKIFGRLSIVVLVIGVVFYYQEKKKEYHGEFKISKFIIGNTDCRNN